MKRLTQIFSLLLLIVGSAMAHAEPLKLNWIDLIPESERAQFDTEGMPAALNHDGGQAKQNMIGTVRTELDGSEVRIPGFVIPLEGDANKVTEFLLVPYFGACIHVPPPPPNQIIYVKFPSGAPVQQLWDVVYVVGELKAQTVEHELAQTGYLINGVEIQPYDDE
ncbi:hypothetical protein JCM19232_1630 [Vibrio ishigakensis]|uniref:Lipoprotein n=1 Tax=Vibrio ishigakensis TaxID=1481914 RepID=A0A0B8QAU6_9VIBR|nr:DUF3299 domain-containing protein [Vibrio ishigakensis]GAM55443.1 hypothetical protein JCM19231_4342 [Vibrio ishigakensis]GAM62473.1 hypothetical protein JCM19232_1630 [Vibrio ishigakensis]GAM67581.1 hypothetical protein JCM19236_4507 [Vibrio sp. JCM 19236]GAM76815.1 hypothetical protein JCM19241_5711 [Vibrio ishigakensis]